MFSKKPASPRYRLACSAKSLRKFGHPEFWSWTDRWAIHSDFLGIQLFKDRSSTRHLTSSMQRIHFPRSWSLRRLVEILTRAPNAPDCLCETRPALINGALHGKGGLQLPSRRSNAHRVNQSVRAESKNLGFRLWVGSHRYTSLRCPILRMMITISSSETLYRIR